MSKSKTSKKPPQRTGKKKPSQKKLKTSPKSLKRKAAVFKSVKKPKKTAVKKSAGKKKNTLRSSQPPKKPKVKKPAQTLKAVKKTKPLAKKTSLKKAVLSQKAVPRAKTSRPAASYLYHLERELERIQEKEKKVPLKNSEGRQYCAEENCDQPAVTGDYCRLHYIMVWRLIKDKNEILSQNKLKTWVGEIIENHRRQAVLDYMVRDLSNEKDFSSALSEMKIPAEEAKDDE